MRSTRWFGPGFLLWMTAVTAFCLVSLDLSDDSGFNIPYGDKLAHFVFYWVGGTLALLALRERFRARISLPGATALVFLGLLLYGILIEGLQWLLPTGRSAEWADVLANTLGLLLAVASMRWVFHASESLNWGD